MRHELGQSSEYPVRTGVADCYYYLKNGGCFFGRSCRYNHPPRNQLGDDTVQPSAYKVRLGATNCEQYLHTGQCTYGSRCWFNHPPARTIPDYPSVIQDVSDEVGAGQNSWLQRRRAQRGKIDCGQRRVSEEERTLRETVPCTVLVLYSQERQTHDLEEQKQRERVYENLRIDQIKASVQSDGGIQTEQRLEIPENHSVNAQENLQEQADVEKEKRKAQEKAQEERSRSLTGNVDQLIQSLQDNIGIGRKKGDGV
uniref:C3H1-type domain-containing protein n=1 Tax=Brassica campestris TaxID=3711 RepID=M4EMX8_BRACM